MFREYDLRYLIPYVILMLTLTGLDIWYEVAVRTGDSWTETLLAIGNGASSAVSTTFITFATVEAVIYMVLAMWRLKKLQKDSEEKQAEARREGRAEGREEGVEEGIQKGREAERQRWQEWVRRVEGDVHAAGVSFKEPPPGDEE